MKRARKRRSNTNVGKSQISSDLGLFFEKFSGRSRRREKRWNIRRNEARMKDLEKDPTRMLEDLKSQWYLSNCLIRAKFNITEILEASLRMTGWAFTQRWTLAWFVVISVEERKERDQNKHLPKYLSTYASNFRLQLHNPVSSSETGLFIPYLPNIFMEILYFLCMYHRGSIIARHKSQGRCNRIEKWWPRIWIVVIMFGRLWGRVYLSPAWEGRLESRDIPNA